LFVILSFDLMMFCLI
jgi:callose synthase